MMGDNICEGRQDRPVKEGHFEIEVKVRRVLKSSRRTNGRTASYDCLCGARVCLPCDSPVCPRCGRSLDSRFRHHAVRRIRPSTVAKAIAWLLFAGGIGIPALGLSGWLLLPVSWLAAGIVAAFAEAFRSPGLWRRTH